MAFTVKGGIGYIAEQTGHSGGVMPRKYALGIIGIGSAIVVLLVALIVIVLNDEGTPVAATTTVPATPEAATTAAPAITTTAAPPTTAAPTTTAAGTTTTEAAATTAAPTTTAEPPPVCIDVGPVPATATDISSHEAMLDGDGLPDGMTAYKLGSTWYLYARIADPSYGLVLPLDAAWAAEYWDGRPVGPVVIQGPRTLGDPRRVVVAQVGAGLAWTYALFGVEGCEIVTFAQPDGMLPDLWVLGSPFHTDVPICDEPDASVRQIIFSCEGIATCPVFDAHVMAYGVERDPARLVLLSDTNETFTRAEYEALVTQSCTAGGY